MAVVSIVRGEDPYEMVLKNFENIHVDGVIQKGDTVVIKPNLADIRRVRYLPRAGDLTSREAIEAVTRAVRENTDADEIVIAEGAATPTWELFFEWKLVEIAEKYHARLVDLNYDEATNIWLKDGIVLNRVWVPRTLQRADVVISLPVLKVWNEVGISMNVKNIAGGCMPRYHYAKLKSLERHIPCNLAKWIMDNNPRFNPEYMYGQSRTLSAACVDLYSACPAHIGIIDAQRVMHMKAPGLRIFSSNDVVLVEGLNLFIGSRDLVAADAVGAAIMGFNPQKIVHLNMAAEKGMGTNRLEGIKIKGMPIEEVRMRCTPVADMDAIVA